VPLKKKKFIFMLLGGTFPAFVRLVILPLSFTPGLAGAATVLGESPTIVAPGDTVDATWSNIETPTLRDWIGLYAQDAQDEHSFELTSWMYTSNCAQNEPDPSSPARASGDCKFVVPGNLAQGTYELHLLADDGFTRLAKSHPFKVTESIELESFSINNGTASTTNPIVTLNFTTAPASLVPDTFRAVEGGSIQKLISQPFVRLESTTSAPFKLALRGRDGARYGGRSILLQVKSGSHLSSPGVDAIRFDPILRDYMTSFDDAAFEYAQRRGYTITGTYRKPDDPDPNSSCNACPDGAEPTVVDQTCTWTTTFQFFAGRQLMPFWQLKNIEPGVGQAYPIGQGMWEWTYKTIILPTSSNDPRGVVCTPIIFQNDPKVRMTFEGPTHDDFVDPGNPWKNAFTPRFSPRPVTPANPR
jgi:hypothetical protein